MSSFNSSNNPCLFSRRDSDGSVLIVGVYVEDIILAHIGNILRWFVDKFTDPKGFTAKHEGHLSCFPGNNEVEQIFFSKGVLITQTHCEYRFI